MSKCTYQGYITQVTDSQIFEYFDPYFWWQLHTVDSISLVQWDIILITTVSDVEMWMSAGLTGRTPVISPDTLHILPWHRTQVPGLAWDVMKHCVVFWQSAVHVVTQHAWDLTTLPASDQAENSCQNRGILKTEKIQECLTRILPTQVYLNLRARYWQRVWDW